MPKRHLAQKRLRVIFCITVTTQNVQTIYCIFRATLGGINDKKNTVHTHRERFLLQILKIKLFLPVNLLHNRADNASVCATKQNFQNFLIKTLKRAIATQKFRLLKTVS